MTEQATATARVLVVEDDEAIADVLRRSLRAEGHDVRSAGDGAEALTAAEQFAPDLVVLDLGLPRLDGMEVCRRLRAESDVPILMLTARTETEDRVKDSTRAQTTTCRSRSSAMSCSPGFGRCSAAARPVAAPRSSSATFSSTRTPAR